MRDFSIRRWLVYLASGLSVVLFILLFAYQKYFTTYIGGIYQSNIDAVMEQITDDLRNMFTTMNTAVEYIAENPNIGDYARTAGSEPRYSKAYELARPIVDAATQNLVFDHLMVSDITGAWYHFSGSMSSLAGRLIKESFNESFNDSRAAVNKVMILDDVSYFCTVKPVMVLENGKSQRVGLVVMLINSDRIRNSFHNYGIIKGMTITLHDFERALISNEPNLEMSDFASIVPDDKSYTHFGTVLADRFGLIISIPFSMIFPQRTTVVMQFLSISVFSIIALLFLAGFVNRNIVRPFALMAEDMRGIGESDLQRRLNLTQVQHVDIMVNNINNMLERLEEYSNQSLTTQKNLYEMGLAYQRSNMYILRNQIDRHFLYNSLISIQTLTSRGESAKAGEVAGGIAQLLRYITSSADEVDIFDEMEMIQRYVKIQNIRFDNKISLEIDVDDRLCECKILKLTIQPIVENALIHGLENQISGCKLYLRGYIIEDDMRSIIRIEVEDNGIGIPSEQLSKIKDNIKNINNVEIGRDVEGIALVNIQKRIVTTYGEGYGLEISSQENAYTLATLTIPMLKR